MRLQHGRTTLELYELQPGSGAGMLLLHELYGSADDWRCQAQAWPGPVYGLDFSGHGQSDALGGGAYSCEMLTGDADCALAECGAVALAGAGLGAYVALLLSGARPQQVRATLLLPGRGLAGAGAVPRFEEIPPLVEDDTPRTDGGPDPLLYVLERDVRPVEYATAFASRAQALLLSEDEMERPPWWHAVRSVAGSVAVRGGVESGLAQLARVVAR